MNAASPMRQPQSTDFRFPEGIEPARQEDLRLVTGTGRYAADWIYPGMLHAYVIRSQVAHALIRKADYSAVREAPGVVAVLTASDVAEAFLRVALRTPIEGRASLYNVGSQRPVRLLDFIDRLGRALNRTPVLEMHPMQPGDVAQTASDCSAFEHDYGYAPTTSIDTGVQRFADWFRDYAGATSFPIAAPAYRTAHSS